MLAPWKKSYDQPRQHVQKQSHSLPTKFHLVKAMVFPVVMYGCERCTIMEAEHWRTDAFELWCWRRLESPSDFKEIKSVNPKGNQLCIVIGRTDAKAAMIQRANSLKKTLSWGRLKAGREGSNREWDGCMASPVNGHEFEQALGIGDKQGSLVCWSPWDRKIQTWLSNWTTMRTQKH